jgi:AraC-like DNA-binding protein
MPGAGRDPARECSRGISDFSRSGSERETHKYLADRERDFAARWEAVVREYMADEDFGVDAVVKALSMSRSTLFPKGRQGHGTSPQGVLWTYRLEQAAHWLRERGAREEG